ncbi:hypothetical protein Dimus_034738 [Dionaea muscipula]
MGTLRRDGRLMSKQEVSKWLTMAEKVSWYSAIFMASMLVMSLCHAEKKGGDPVKEKKWNEEMVKRACDEIYVVREGETLQTIGDKCGDPFIVEENPHIHDPDDVFPGLTFTSINHAFATLVVQRAAPSMKKDEEASYEYQLFWIQWCHGVAIGSVGRFRINPFRVRVTSNSGHFGSDCHRVGFSIFGL